MEIPAAGFVIAWEMREGVMDDEAIFGGSEDCA